MFEKQKYYKQFVRLTDADDGCEVWVDLAKVVMIKSWTKTNDKTGQTRTTTYLAMESRFATEVKESIEVATNSLDFFPADGKWRKEQDNV